MDAHVLEVFHGSSQIEVLDVNAHVYCIVFCALDGSVDVNLHIEEGDCWGIWVARIVEFVAACCEAYVMCLLFLWADVSDEVCIGYFPVFGDPVFSCEKHCVCAFYAVCLRSGFSNSCAESSEFVC